jgi:hypothetical protein
VSPLWAATHLVRATPMAKLNHGHTRNRRLSPTYATWQNMRRRCLNPEDKSYESYGLRGITVCERWESFSNFLEDLGDKPSGLTLERRNNELGYSPENCYYASHAQQSRNRRSNVLIEFQGHTRCLTDWAQLCGIKRLTLNARLAAGWPIEKALTAPVQIRRPNPTSPMAAPRAT